MVTVTHSTVLDHAIAGVWALIRDFNNYPAYIDGVSESVIEDDRAGDEIGAVRRFNYGGSWLRQRLAAHSDADHCLTYEGLEPFALPDADAPAPVDYRGTMRLHAVADTDHTLIEWSVALDAPEADADGWRAAAAPMIAGWAESLKAALARRDTMRTAVSRLFDHSADDIWAAIRDFGEYRWGEGVGAAEIEGGGDAALPGAIRAFAYYGQPSRQRLLARSDVDLTMAWESVEPFDATLSHYRAALKVSPITATGGALVEWSVRFEASADAADHWRAHQVGEFGKSLERLRRLLDDAGGKPISY